MPSGADSAGDPSGGARDTVQRYRILRPHARGNLGQVYVALDTELGREVALKEILGTRVRDGRYRDRFVVEAEITGRLQHPGIVPVYGLGTYPDGRPYYAMRFISGGSLKESIERFHRGLSPDPETIRTQSTIDHASLAASPEHPQGDPVLSNESGDGGAPQEPAPAILESRSVELRRLLRRFQDVCNAVEYAHSRGVLHRDLKPANIVVGQHGETLVVDWGLAKATGRSDDLATAVEPPLQAGSDSVGETQPGQALGTPAYASPEQMAGELDRLGPATDVYGLGGILYTILTGKLAFGGERHDLRVLPWGDGSEVPTSGSRLVIIGTNASGLLHVRTFDAAGVCSETYEALQGGTLHLVSADASGNILSNSPGSSISAVRCRAIARLKEQISGRLPTHALSESEKGEILNTASLVSGQPHAPTLPDVLRAVLAGQFPAPRSHDPSIPKPLEAVCLKAMALRPEDRYATAKELGEEVERWLADEPVRARPEPVPERLRRWGRRHRPAMAAGAAVLVMAVLGLGAVSAVQTRARNELADKNADLTRARNDLASKNADLTQARNELVERNTLLDQQRQRAESREQQAIDAVARFRDVIVKEPQLKNTPKLQELRKRLLAEPLVYFKNLRNQLRADQGTRPESLNKLAKAAFNLGEISYEIGDMVQARLPYEEARNIFARLVDATPSVNVYQNELAGCHNNIGILQQETGQPADALKSYEAALAIQKRLVDANPSVTKFQNDLANSHSNIGTLLSETGQPANALKSYEAALAIRRRLVIANPSVAEFQNNLANSHNNIGTLQRETSQPGDALKSYEAALEIRRQIVKADPSVAEFQNDLAASHINIGALLSATGQTAAALKSLESALAIQERLVDANPSVTKFQRNLAISQHSIGILLRQTGQPADALKSYESALAIQERLVDANPSVAEFQHDLATSHHNIGALLSATGQPAAALKSFEVSLAIQERLVDANPAATEFQNNLATSHKNIGALQKRTGQPTAALKSYEAALEIRKRLFAAESGNPDHMSSLGETLNDMAMIDLSEGRAETARNRLLQAIDWQRRALTVQPDHPRYRAFLKNHLTNLIKANEALELPEDAAEARRQLESLTS